MAGDAAGTPFQPYGGVPVAPFAPDTLEGYDRLRSIADTPNAVNEAATGNTLSLLENAKQPPTLQDLQPFMNPYTQGVTDIAQENLMENYDVMRQQLLGNKALSGSFGGARHGLQEGELQRGLLRNAMELQYGAGQDNFNQAMDNYYRGQGQNIASINTAMGQSSALRDQQVADASNLTNIGGAYQQNAQGALDFGVGEFGRGVQYPFDTANFFSNIAYQYPWQASPQHSSGTQQSTTDTTQPGPSLFEQIAGVGMGVAGLMGGNPLGMLGSIGKIGGSLLGGGSEPSGTNGWANMTSSLLPQFFADGGQVSRWADGSVRGQEQERQRAYEEFYGEPDERHMPRGRDIYPEEMDPSIIEYLFSWPQFDYDTPAWQAIEGLFNLGIDEGTRYRMDNYEKEQEEEEPEGYADGGEVDPVLGPENSTPFGIPRGALAHGTPEGTIAYNPYISDLYSTSPYFEGHYPEAAAYRAENPSFSFADLIGPTGGEVANRRPRRGGRRRSGGASPGKGDDVGFTQDYRPPAEGSSLRGTFRGERLSDKFDWAKKGYADGGMVANPITYAQSSFLPAYGQANPMYSDNARLSNPMGTRFQARGGIGVPNHAPIGDRGLGNLEIPYQAGTPGTGAQSIYGDPNVNPLGDAINQMDTSPFESFKGLMGNGDSTPQIQHPTPVMGGGQNPNEGNNFGWQGQNNPFQNAFQGSGGGDIPMQRREGPGGFKEGGLVKGYADGGVTTDLTGAEPVRTPDPVSDELSRGQYQGSDSFFPSIATLGRGVTGTMDFVNKEAFPWIGETLGRMNDNVMAHSAGEEAPSPGWSVLGMDPPRIPHTGMYGRPGREDPVVVPEEAPENPLIDTLSLTGGDFMDAATGDSMMPGGDNTDVDDNPLGAMAEEVLQPKKTGGEELEGQKNWFDNIRLDMLMAAGALLNGEGFGAATDVMGEYGDRREEQRRHDRSVKVDDYRYNNEQDQWNQMFGLRERELEAEMGARQAREAQRMEDQMREIQEGVDEAFHDALTNNTATAAFLDTIERVVPYGSEESRRRDMLRYYEQTLQLMSQYPAMIEQQQYGLGLAEGLGQMLGMDETQIREDIEVAASGAVR